MEAINMKTVIYIFNEEGIIIESNLKEFCSNFEKRTSFNFTIQRKTKEVSSVYQLFSKDTLSYTIFDHGYVMKIEGEIKQSIFLLKELDEIIDDEILYFTSPTQRISNSENYKFPRQSSIKEIARFLDKLFINDNYTKSLNTLS